MVTVTLEAGGAGTDTERAIPGSEPRRGFCACKRSVVLGRDVCQPEKRKVGSSTLPLTTSFGLVSSALTSANAYLALSCPQPLSDHDCPCVTVVSRLLSHADRTSCRCVPERGLFVPSEVQGRFGQKIMAQAGIHAPAWPRCPRSRSRRRSALAVPRA